VILAVAGVIGTRLWSPFVGATEASYEVHVQVVTDDDGFARDVITIDVAGEQGQVRCEARADVDRVSTGTMTRDAVDSLRRDLARLLRLGRFSLGYVGRIHVVVNGREWSNGPPTAAASPAGSGPAPGSAEQEIHASDQEEGLRLTRRIVRAAHEACGLPAKG
jgi:hypothetical protein